MGFAGRRIAKGSIWLSAGQIISTSIVFVGSIFIARLLKPDEYGLISIALLFPGLLLGLLDLGVSEAIIRFSSLDRGRGYLSTIFVFKIMTAFVTSLIIFILSDYMATILNRPYISSMIKILSIYTLSEIINGSVGQILISFGEYDKAVFLSMIRNSVRVIVSVSLILLGLGVYGSIWGFSIASATVLAISITYISKYISSLSFKKDLFKEIMSFSLPLYIPGLIGFPLNQIIDIFLAKYASNIELGNYSVANNLLTSLGIIGGSMATSIYSTLPLLLGREDKLREVVYKSVIYTSIIIVPLAIGLVVFSKPLVYLIYGDKYILAPFYLSLSALTGLSAVLGSYVIGSYLKAIGETSKIMRISFVNYLIYMPLALILIPIYRVFGLIISSLTAGFISTIYGLYIVQKDLGLSVVSIRNIIILGALSLPGVLAWLLSLAPINFMIETFLKFVVYMISLIMILPIVIRENEVLELIEITKGIKLINLIAPKILSMILMILGFINRDKSKL
jgi:O-antigen/teichoic acid export membrane protein